jgi:hypothetical protein
MSSHQRKQRRLLPSFPSLPVKPTFEDTTKFAKLSQLALHTFTEPEADFLYLPLISPHSLQKCFKVSENKVFVIQRKSYLKLKELVRNVDRAEYYGIYLK